MPSDFLLTKRDARARAVAETVGLEHEVDSFGRIAQIECVALPSPLARSVPGLP